MKIFDLSIGIPTYNRADYLRTSVESALKQKNCNVEVIICNNASTDNTEEILKPYLLLSNFKYIRNLFNLGPIANYNKCLENATGNYFMLIGDDDWLSGNYGEVMLESVAGRDEIFLGKCIVVDPQGTKIRESSDQPYNYDGEKYIQLFLRKAQDIRRQTWFMLCAQTGTFKNCGGFPLTQDAQHSENMLLMNMAIGRQIIYNPKAMCYYRLHPQSYGNTSVFSVAIASVQFYDYWRTNVEPKLYKKTGKKIKFIRCRIKLIVQLSWLYIYRVIKYGPKSTVGKLHLLIRFPYKSWLIMATINKVMKKILKLD